MIPKCGTLLTLTSIYIGFFTTLILVLFVLIIFSTSPNNLKLQLFHERVFYMKHLNCRASSIFKIVQCVSRVFCYCLCSRASSNYCYNIRIHSNLTWGIIVPYLLKFLRTLVGTLSVVIQIM